MYLIRVRDVIVNMEHVKTIFIGDGIVSFDDGTGTPLNFAIPEAGIRSGAVTVPMRDEELKSLIEMLCTSPSIIVIN